MDKPAHNSVPEHPPAIALRDVTFGWSRSAPPLLHIDNLSIARAERVFLYGPSGSGKTSLLNLLAGVNLPQTGDVTLLGEKLNRLSGRKRDRFRARHIGVVFQQFNLIPYLSVLDNVLLAAHFARLPAAPSRARAQELLSHLALDDTLATRPARTLSVGQQQRVAVARALVSEPEILLADEPTSALDSDTRDAFLELLLTSAARNDTTLVFVSHDRALQAHFSRALDVRELVHQGEHV